MLPSKPIMPSRLALILGLLALTGTAMAQEPPTMFSMPSGNVNCVFTPAGGSTVYKSADGSAELSCDREAPSYVRVTMTETSAVTIETKVSDQGCCSTDNPLAYGEEWKRGPFACESKQSGLTCRRSDGRGFSVARAGVTKF